MVHAQHKAAASLDSRVLLDVGLSHLDLVGLVRDAALLLLDRLASHDGVGRLVCGRCRLLAGDADAEDAHQQAEEQHAHDHADHDAGDGAA